MEEMYQDAISIWYKEWNEEGQLINFSQTKD